MHSTIERSTIAVVAILGFNIAQLVSCYAQSFPTDSSDASGTLARLAIGVPRNVAADAAIHQPLEELGRERCDKEAISHLAKALDQAGYRREAAVAQVNFSSQCGGYAPALRGAVNMLLKLSDYTTAEHIASDLIRLEPFSDNGYFLRALAHDGNKSFKSAIDDYVTAIEMFGNKDRINSVGYYNMARDYERLGQFCDAMLPIERWVALDPSRHDTTQTRAMLSDYAAKGGCAAASSGGTETFPAAGPGRVVKVIWHFHIGHWRKLRCHEGELRRERQDRSRTRLHRAPSYRKRRGRRQTRPRRYDPVAVAQGERRASCD